MALLNIWLSFKYAEEVRGCRNKLELSVQHEWKKIEKDENDEIKNGIQSKNIVQQQKKNNFKYNLAKTGEQEREREK